MPVVVHPIPVTMTVICQPRSESGVKFLRKSHEWFLFLIFLGYQYKKRISGARAPSHLALVVYYWQHQITIRSVRHLGPLPMYAAQTKSCFAFRPPPHLYMSDTIYRNRPDFPYETIFATSVEPKHWFYRCRHWPGPRYFLWDLRPHLGLAKVCVFVSFWPCFIYGILVYIS